MHLSQLPVENLSLQTRMTSLWSEKRERERERERFHVEKMMLTWMLSALDAGPNGLHPRLTLITSRGMSPGLLRLCPCDCSTSSLFRPPRKPVRARVFEDTLSVTLLFVAARLRQTRN